MPTYSGNSGGDAYYCQYVDGYWGQWQKVVAFRPQFIGRPDDFGVGFMTSSPRLYFAKIRVNGFNKKDLKSNGSFTEYSGTIEYTIHDGKPENRHNILKQSRAFVEYFGKIEGSETITRPVTIKICKGRRRGAIIYNIFFDHVGIGLDIPWN